MNTWEMRWYLPPLIVDLGNCGKAANGLEQWSQTQFAWGPLEAAPVGYRTITRGRVN